jgi:dihydrofolate reductase
LKNLTGLLKMKMLISLIVAMDRCRGIGKDNRVPWHLRADLQRFKALTMGHHLIVGRKTWESIGRPLPGRKLVIITRDPRYRPENCPECVVVGSPEAALDLARNAGETEAFIGGGGEIFELTQPLADRIYLTEVDTDAGCDVFFPPVNLSDWQELERIEQGTDEQNEFPFVYRLLAR